MSIRISGSRCDGAEACYLTRLVVEIVVVLTLGEEINTDHDTRHNSLTVA
jgi:hypothetical protein